MTVINSSTSNIPFIKTDAAMFFNRTIPQTCREIHSLAIDLLKIPNWIIRKKYIADQLNVSLRTVNRYFNLLVKLGYAYYDEVKHRWHVFRNPKPNKVVTSTEGGLPVVEQGGLPHLAAINQIELYSEEKPQPAPMSEQQSVVVFEEIERQVETIIIPDPVTALTEDKDVLVYPVQLNESQTKEAKKKIKKAPIDMQQAILYCLARCIASGTVKSPLAYLSGLITRANNGTFEVIGAANATMPDSRRKDDTPELIAAQRALTKSKPEVGKVKFAGIRSAIRGIV